MMVFSLLLVIWVRKLLVYAQLNLYDTEQIITTNMMGYDCLHYYARGENVDIRYDTSIKQVIKYCIRPTDNIDIVWTNSGTIYHNNFTFDQLRFLNVTTEQLLFWSASIDLFGSQCQYSFIYDTKESFALVVENKFHQIKSSVEDGFELMKLPCYNHLPCNRGGNDFCLDWREICNGKIDCVDDGMDEADCFQMEINECQEDEYQCHNGLCIPKDFWKDDKDNPDCLDRSDESNIPLSFDFCYQTPTFRCEEHTCRPGNEDFSCGDGQCVKEFDVCKNARNDLFKESLLIKDDLSNECWLYLTCFSLITHNYDGKLCHSLIHSFNGNNAKLSMCQSIFQFPKIYALLGHIRFFYQSNQSVPFSVAIIDNEKPSGDISSIQLGSSLANLIWVFHPHTSIENLLNDYSYLESIMEPFISKPNWDTFNLLQELAKSAIFSKNVCPSSSFIRSDIQQNTHLKAHVICFNILLPDIIYYGQSFWNFISPTFHYDNMTCLYRHQLNLSKTDNYEEFTLAIKDYFRGCLTTTNDQFQLDSSLYCCQNSSKCISKHRLLDGILDCHMGDDETYNLSCSLNDSFRFKCDKNDNQCYSPLVNSDVCKRHVKTNINEINFQDFCDGIDDFFFQEIHGKHYTDETECNSYWPCNNIYTRCDQRSACSNGEDEENCIDSKCPSYSHPCISMENLTVICLSVEHINDGTIDCLGASDEFEFCLKKKSTLDNQGIFYCFGNQKCIPSSYLCDRKSDCSRNADEKFCRSDQSICSENYHGNRSNIKQILCQRYNEKVDRKYFSLKTSFEYPLWQMEQSSKVKQLPIEDIKSNLNDSSWIQLCNRGIYAQIQSDDDNNTYRCFCPPNYYGSQCQYQSQRVSLTLRFLPFNRHSIYSILIKLIDQNGLINSYEQLTFMPIWGCKFKFNIYLLYSTGPKDPLKNYSLHIDAYEKQPLIHYTSWFLPKSFNFLPVNRVAAQLVLPIERIKPVHSCYLTCQNGGQSLKYENTNEFYGLNCQHRKRKLTIDLTRIEIPTHIQVYISSISNQSQPSNLIFVKKLTHEQNLVSFYLSIPYHMVFIKIINTFYLAVVQQNPKDNLLTCISSKQRCYPISEVLNSTVIILPMIRRVKYYPLTCQKVNKPWCFYDEMYMCLCTSEFYPNCFQFDHQQSKFTCSYNNYCKNNALCLQDDPTCPSNTICICSDCYFGTQCQFYAKGFGLTLDDILRFEIRPKLTLFQQKISIKISAILTITMFILGLINGFCSSLTFQRENSKKVGCGLYLLSSSITSIFTMMIFTTKFWFLILSQMNLITNRLILLIGCISIEPLLKIFLSIDTWFNACVAIERAISVFQGVQFRKQTSKNIAKRIRILLPLVIVCTFIHEPIYRDLFDDEEEQRIWCVTNYNQFLQTYNSTIILIHFLIPFIINVCSALYIIRNVSRRRSAAQTVYSYWQHLYKQFLECKHILISPLVLIILSSPRLIISLMSSCIKSSRDPWLFLSGYFISFIPSMLVFIIFVLPSDLYKKEFKESIQSWRSSH
ncbi:hypothetical protein I4U23_004306 [Adineta vaga]|nr:hypothetical protein I4U23_004306 [Adineta vaga]